MMAHEEELRIGIGEGTSFYRGDLEGRTLEIPQIPAVLKVTETTILSDVDNYRLSIRTERPHFYLTVRGSDGKFTTELSIVNLYRSGIAKNGDQVFIGQAINTKGRFEHSWYLLPQPPSIDELLVAIPEIILKRGPEKYQDWMKRMTPEGWVRPE